MGASELHQEAQREALRYEKATVEHSRAKEFVHLAEQCLNRNKDSPSETVKWEQLLTSSAEMVNSAESERSLAERQHELSSKAYSQSEQKLAKLHKQLKRSIVKAR